MKLSAKFAALFAAVLLLIVPTLAPAAQEQAQSLSPSLVSAGFEADKSSVAPGSTVKLAFKLKNTSAGIAVRNVNIRVSGGEALIVSQGSDSVWADTIAAGAVYSFSKSFIAVIRQRAEHIPSHSVRHTNTLTRAKSLPARRRSITVCALRKARSRSRSLRILSYLIFLTGIR